MQIAMPVNELQTIILYKFQDEYLVHMMYKEHASFGIGFYKKGLFTAYPQTLRAIHISL